MLHQAMLSIYFAIQIEIYQVYMRPV